MNYMALKTQLKKPADTIYTNRYGEGFLVLDVSSKEISWCETAEVSPDGISVSFKNKLFALNLIDESVASISYTEQVFKTLRKIVVGRVVVEMNKAFEWKHFQIKQFVFGKAPLNGEEELIFMKNAIKRSEIDRDAAREFVERCNAITELHKIGKQKFEALKNELRANCRSSAVVDLRQLAAEYFETLLFLVCLDESEYLRYFEWGKLEFQPITSLSYDLKSISHNLTLEMCADFFEKLLREMIVQGILTGLLEKEKRQYVDRNFAIKEQRVMNVNLDFNNLVAQLGNKGVVLNSIQCPQCGAPCKLPPSGDKFFCGACGCAIQATDLFEKFKGILG